MTKKSSQWFSMADITAAISKIITRKAYSEMEEKLRQFSKKINIPMDELDLLFWSLETGKVFK